MDHRVTAKFVAVLGTVLLFLPSAQALCGYHGKMYARTTLRQEFADSRWVVRAKVVAADNHWSDNDASWTMYEVQVVRAFKGKPAERLKVFTFRDSGGFFLDAGMFPDLGGEYLLFLDPVTKNSETPSAAHNATEVNYSCGQSRSWRKMTSAQARLLTQLSK